MMVDKNKVKSFIRTLSDYEVTSQLNDLFSFMVEYRILLLEEQSIRQYNSVFGTSSGTSDYAVDNDSPDEYDNEPDYENDFNASPLDFNLLNSIHSKVADYSIDELLEAMKELDDILSNPDEPLPAESFETCIAIREACEVRYFDEFQMEPVTCSNCGTYLRPSQKFCGKCGALVSEN